MTPRLAAKWGPTWPGDSRTQRIIFGSRNAIAKKRTRDGYVFGVTTRDGRVGIRDVDVQVRAHVFGTHVIECLVISMPDEHRVSIPGLEVRNASIFAGTTRGPWDDIVKHEVKPHAQVLTSIAKDGGVGVVVHQPSSVGRAAARSLGWDGKSSAFRMGDAAQDRLIANLKRLGDYLAVQWLRSERGRIVVIAANGTLLVNFNPRVGFSLELGSTDRAIGLRYAA